MRSEKFRLAKYQCKNIIIIIRHHLCTVQQSQCIKQAMSYVLQAAVRNISRRHLVECPYQIQLLCHITLNVKVLHLEFFSAKIASVDADEMSLSKMRFSNKTVF
jgi:hypothetical protein